MKIDELIQELEEVREEHGNAEVLAVKLLNEDTWIKTFHEDGINLNFYTNLD